MDLNFIFSIFAIIISIISLLLSMKSFRLNIIKEKRRLNSIMPDLQNSKINENNNETSIVFKVLYHPLTIKSFSEKNLTLNYSEGILNRLDKDKTFLISVNFESKDAKLRIFYADIEENIYMKQFDLYRVQKDNYSYEYSITSGKPKSITNYPKS